MIILKLVRALSTVPCDVCGLDVAYFYEKSNTLIRAMHLRVTLGVEIMYFQRDSRLTQRRAHSKVLSLPLQQR
jgi:hypothetical protein